MRKTLKILLTLLVLLATWYLLLKPSDLTVHFSTKALPGTIEQSIKLWAKNNQAAFATNNIGKNRDIVHMLNIENSVFEYRWIIDKLNDSLSKVSVNIKDTDLKNSLLNRIIVFFPSSNFLQISKKTVNDFKGNLDKHLKEFKVSIIGEETFQERSFAYTSISQTQFGKAKGMMDDANYISDILMNNNIKSVGLPVVEIIEWDQNADSLYFNFGYPIETIKNIPNLGDVKIKKLKATKALKAIYNGNYITSDRAWYQLLNYAKKNNIKVKTTPLEVFHNNPHMGGDAMKWVTEVYMPLDTTSTID